MLQPGEVGKGVLVACAAHLKRGAQVVAHGRPIGLAEDQAVVIVGELRTAHTGQFAVGQAGDGGRNRGFDAACAAADTTVHAIRHRAAVRVLFAR